MNEHWNVGRLVSKRLGKDRVSAPHRYHYFSVHPSPFTGTALIAWPVKMCHVHQDNNREKYIGNLFSSRFCHVWETNIAWTLYDILTILDSTQFRSLWLMKYLRGRGWGRCRNYRETSDPKKNDDGASFYSSNFTFLAFAFIYLGRQSLGRVQTQSRRTLLR